MALIVAGTREMYTIISEHVFPWLRTLGGNGTTYSKHMEGARFTIAYRGEL
jgi:type I restriction enzyme M protein